MHAHRAGHLFALSWHGEKNIKRLLQSLAKSSLNRSTPLAAATAFLLLAPLSLFAGNTQLEV